ncbi:MAG: hypothetical protein WCQ48_01155 [Chloroflexota bacterium]
MTLRPLLICAQCGDSIEDRPVALGDEVFCCLGCVGCGPCICERSQPTPFQMSVGPFASHEALLRFGSRLERLPGLARVEMTRADLEDARFAVTTSSTEVLALAVESDPDYTATVEVTGTAIRVQLAPAQGTPRTPTVDALLPTRTRFRVFRTPSETPIMDDAPRRSRYLAPRERQTSNESQVAEVLVASRETATATRPASTRSPEHTAAPAPEAPAEVRETAQPASIPTREVQEILIVASRFQSFLALNEFQIAMRALPGVRDTRIRRFYGGALTLGVDYSDEVPLADRLRSAGGEWRIVSIAPEHIEVALSASR